MLLQIEIDVKVFSQVLHLYMSEILQPALKFNFILKTCKVSELGNLTYKLFTFLRRTQSVKFDNFSLLIFLSIHVIRTVAKVPDFGTFVRNRHSKQMQVISISMFIQFSRKCIEYFTIVSAWGTFMFEYFKYKILHILIFKNLIFEVLSANFLHPGGLMFFLRLVEMVKLIV